MKFRPFSVIRSRSGPSPTFSNSFIFYSFRTLGTLGPPKSRDNPFSFLLLRTLDQNIGEWPVSACGKVANPAVSSALSSLQSRVSPWARCELSTFQLSTFNSRLLRRFILANPLESSDSEAQVCNSFRMNTYTNAALKTLWNEHLQNRIIYLTKGRQTANLSGRGVRL